MQQPLGYVPETSRLYPELRVDGFLRFAAGLRGMASAEARHAVERAVILSSGPELGVGDFQLQSSPDKLMPSFTEVDSSPSSGDSDVDLNLARLEKRTIELALQQHRYNISRAARELGLTRAALYRRMEKHGL